MIDSNAAAVKFRLPDVCNCEKQKNSKLVHDNRNIFTTGTYVLGGYNSYNKSTTKYMIGNKFKIERQQPTIHSCQYNKSRIPESTRQEFVQLV